MENKDKKIMVTRATMPSYEEYCEMIKPIWESHWLTNNGSLHNELEEQIKVYLGVKNVTLYTNGHLALENAIAALNLHGEVITTPFTFVSTTNAISRNGLTPVFCDVKEDNYTINPEKIEALITEKTSAIVPVHVYGNVCDVEAIEKIAKKHNLRVIYDAAHAFAEIYKGKSVANYGDIAMFSFHATKVFNTIEGGGLAYNYDSLKKITDRLKNFGIKDEEHIDYVGGNAKMNEFQAAMGLCNLKHLDENIKRRKEIVTLYRGLLSKIKGLKLCPLDSNVEYNYSYFPVVITDEYGMNREELVSLLNKNNIFPRKYFYPLTNEVECYPNNNGEIETPIAHDISRRVLTLPLYPDLEDEDVKRICKIIKEK